VRRAPVVRPAARAAEFIAQDAIHEPAHDARLWDLRVRRDAAARGVHEWERLRDLASKIREHTLGRLDAYLEEFEHNAERKGIRVHWARDAGEHNRIVFDIFRARGVTEVVKSKSMLQEECGMTPFLEERGIRVTETDLGERIQQLDGQPPGHIVMPAIHKTRADIARLFAREIGSDAGNDDPRYLTESMRRSLRERFLAAGACMTGANFAVAGTGAFVVCTNEGNADLGASLPPLHVASIGIEKIVPRTEHLGVLVRLLSRSALGSPITRYTSHFAGPRRGGEMHVVLVDNGRSRLLGREEFRRSLKCIRCGACMNTCPVFRHSGGLAYGSIYSGPIGAILGPAMDERKFRELPFHSTLCGSCTQVCPVKVDISDQILAWRRVLSAGAQTPLLRRQAVRTAGRILGSPKILRAVTKAGRRLLAGAPRILAGSRLLSPWTQHRDLPPAPRRSFREWYLDERKGRGTKQP